MKQSGFLNCGKPVVININDQQYGVAGDPVTPFQYRIFMNITVMKKIRKSAAVLSALMLLLTLGGCGSDSGSRPKLNLEMSGWQNTYSFGAESSEMLTLSEDGAAVVLTAVKQQQADYAYAELYKLEEVQTRLSFDASVDSHEYCALNDAGTLDAGHLTELVTANNAEFLTGNSYLYQEIESGYLSEICGFIVRVIGEMQTQYPDIDWQRVYCNLGNLKIVYKPGMLNYAQVSSELVLSISESNTQIILNLKGEDAFSRVLTHEIMHIIQVGCTCEQIENCERRAGISVYWDDFDLNTTDWTWFVEGSAERNMCNLTGGDAVSYQYKMDYICSFTMSVLLREEAAADTMETVCFYDDPQLLFDVFGCDTPEEQAEILRMMITMEVLQSQPEAFFEAYAAAYGADPREDTETLNQFSYSLKPAVCITLAKEFYENLVLFLQENQVSCNDLFFLLNLFESHLNQHLTYTVESKAQINEPFLIAYAAMRDTLFRTLEQDNLDLDLKALYADYQITAAEGSLNADLSILPEEKRNFLAERAQWLTELNGLGQKVPALSPV